MHLFPLVNIYESKKAKELLKQPENYFNLDLANLVLKSSSAFYFIEGYKYATKIGKSANTTVLSILRTVDPGPASSNWMLRFDKAHPGTNYPHLNMRHKYTGINDPHFQLPPGSLTVAPLIGYFSKFLNVLRKCTWFFDGYRMSVAVKEDIRAGTVDNTVVCITDIIFAWLGGIIGAAVFGSVGTLFLPGVGTLAGAIVGSIIGVSYARGLASKLTSKWKEDEVYYPLANEYGRRFASNLSSHYYGFANNFA